MHTPESQQAAYAQKLLEAVFALDLWGNPRLVLSRTILSLSHRVLSTVLLCDDVIDQNQPLHVKLVQNQKVSSS